VADKKDSNNTKITSVIAREEDGNIQITFTIPYNIIQAAQDETILEMAKEVDIPGFRKGTAPISKVKEKISQQHVIEHSLSHLLPNALSQAITENKLKIAIYPKFELLKANEGEDWQIRGTTCELPEVDLGDYKKEVTGALRSDSIVVPGKDTVKEKSKEEKESIVLKALLNSVKINIPRILVEEESDSRLSSLLARLEKLGLALENYLKSVNKNAEDLRAEYATQSREAIAMDLILNKVAENEHLIVDPKEVETAMQISQASGSMPQEAPEDTESRKRLLESILKRRKALDFLLSLA
jgi:FKBP-type peptidyl-prolyl cis-trans isomerase (trigger factor)